MDLIIHNKRDFKWLDNEYVVLTHNNILTLCTHFNYLHKEEAKEIYEEINNSLEYPLRYNFEEVCEKSIQRFR